MEIKMFDENGKEITESKAIDLSDFPAETFEGLEDWIESPMPPAGMSSCDAVANCLATMKPKKWKFKKSRLFIYWNERNKSDRSTPATGNITER